MRLDPLRSLLFVGLAAFLPLFQWLSAYDLYASPALR